MLRKDGNYCQRKEKWKDGAALVNLITRHYSRQGLWTLFLLCAFPLHAWTLILAFRDISWLTERTNAWDAVGVVSYGLVFAFLESVIIFLVAVLLGYLASGRWNQERRIALLAVLVLISALWAMLGQLYFLLEAPLPGAFIAFMVQTEHPLRVLYGAALAVVTLTFLIPALLVLRSDRVFHFVRGMIDRLSILTMFYLFFDVVGLIIVIIRNV